jgi:hypothetical protein
VDSTSSFLRFIGSSYLYLSGSSVTIGIEIHKDTNATAAYIDDFKAYLLIHRQGMNY